MPAERPRGGAARDARRRRVGRAASAATARSRRPGGIARAIVDARRVAPIASAEELAALIDASCRPTRGCRAGPHPATRVFQALRIAVNEELEALEAGLHAAVDLLRPGGRLSSSATTRSRTGSSSASSRPSDAVCVCPPEVPVCVCGRNPRLRLVTRRSVTPSAAEIIANPRARSARMRAAERLAA